MKLFSEVHIFLIVLSGLLMTGQGLDIPASAPQPTDAGRPYLVPLRRESVPVRRHGKIASFKTSYSGVISVGSPKPQEFRVVFDTGSGHVVLPALECGSESCLLHRRYNMAASSSALLVNQDGTTVEPGDYADQATVGFGTGEITGEFVKDRVCLGPADVAESVVESEGQPSPPCMDVALIMAIEMSAQPFKTFAFDGILGLGLSSLALHPSFSLFDVFTQGSSVGSPYFAVYLTESEDGGEQSEVAIGGYNTQRLLQPLVWSPVAKKELGYWQVRILAIRVNGQTLDVCQDGTCHGVVDTGSSHLGVPAPYDKEFAELLTQDARDILDCRLIDAPTIEIELPGANLTISPETYMRRLPLREGVNVGSAKGVSMAAADPKPPSGERAEGDSMSVLSVNVTTGAGLVDTASVKKAAPAADPVTQEVALPQKVKRHCRPKMMPVTMPAPLGPKLFILGEPLLHRYYTVYDWSTPRIGFGLAASQRNVHGPGEDRRGSLPEGMDTILMQQQLNVAMDSVSAQSQGWTDSDSDTTIFAQVSLTIVVAVPRALATLGRPAYKCL